MKVHDEIPNRPRSIAESDLVGLSFAAGFEGLHIFELEGDASE